MSDALRSFGVFEDRVERIEAGVNGLNTKRAVEAAADDQHGRSMHQRPHCQHEARVLPWIASQALRNSLPDQIERGP